LPTPHRILGVDPRGAIFLAKEGVFQTGYVARVDWESGTARDGKPLRAVPYTDSRRAVFSPDGSKLEFEAKWPSNGVHPGWVTPTVLSLNDGAQRSYPTRLTIRDAPVWSSDGRSLVFIAEPEGGVGEAKGVPWQFWRLDLNTGAYTREGSLQTTGQLRAAGASARGIVYQRNVNSPLSAAIEEFDLSARSTRVLYQRTDAEIQGSALSSDGRRVAFTVPGAGNREITVSILTLPEQQPKPLITLGRTGTGQLSWLRGDQALLVSGRINNQDGLWRVPLDGSTPSLMRFGQRGVTEVRVSQDGEHVTYTARTPTAGAVLVYEPRP